jgi:hypothetical protein
MWKIYLKTGDPGTSTQFRSFALVIKPSCTAYGKSPPPPADKFFTYLMA